MVTADRLCFAGWPVEARDARHQQLAHVLAHERCQHDQRIARVSVLHEVDLADAREVVTTLFSADDQRGPEVARERPEKPVVVRHAPYLAADREDVPARLLS